MTLGTYPAVGLKEARWRARQAAARVTAGDDPAAAKQERRAADTFEGLALQWIAFKQRQGRAASYMKRSVQRLAMLPEDFRSAKAMEIKRVDITGVLDATARRGVKTETNRSQALISAVYKWAVSEGLLDRDPSLGIKRRFDEEPRQRVFTDAEVRVF
jgi:hypothetical protein